ncbi:MAG: hypothetical protein ACRDTC_05495 [Pseudonocardiaceae bacterium]
MAVLIGVIAGGSAAGAYVLLSRSDEPVTSDVTNTAVSPVSIDQQQGPRTVAPRPGMLHPRPVAWRKAEAVDSRMVRVSFSSGVEPCYVLDHVTVDYGASEVTITLYQGSDPQAEHTACIQIAVEKVTDVRLDQPLGGRAIVDGAQ